MEASVHREKRPRWRLSSPTITSTVANGIIFFCLLCVSTVSASSHRRSALSDGCDWIGSGLEESSSSPSSQSVRPVYLRCSQGSVSWLYPRGALRVVLRYGTAGKEFQGCLKLSSDFAGANVYVERHRTLKLLHSPSSDLLVRPDGKRHCFDSYQGQVTIFLESESGTGNRADPLRRETAAFDYDLQLADDADAQSPSLGASPSATHDPWQECRPCSVQETLELFCSSDFVARGSISAVYNDAQLERTLLTVRATRVIRQASDVFRPLNSKPEKNVRRKKRFIPAPSKYKGADGLEEVLTNEVDDVEDDVHVGTLHVPLACQVKHGQGEFIFMGRRRLGDPVLWCAPRAEEWAAMVQQSISEGSAQCRLQA